MTSDYSTTSYQYVKWVNIAIIKKKHNTLKIEYI